jgi:hypothetical protein
MKLHADRSDDPSREAFRAHLPANRRRVRASPSAAAEIAPKAPRAELNKSGLRPHQTRRHGCPAGTTARRTRLVRRRMNPRPGRGSMPSKSSSSVAAEQNASDGIPHPPQTPHQGSIVGTPPCSCPMRRTLCKRQHAACNRLHDTRLKSRPGHCVSPTTRSRDGAVAFPAGNCSVRRWPERPTELGQGAQASIDKSGLSHARTYVPPLRSAGTAPQRSRSSGSPRGTLPRVRQLTIRSNNGDSEPDVPREPVLRRSTCPRRGERTACTGASHPAPSVIHSAH